MSALLIYFATLAADVVRVVCLAFAVVVATVTFHRTSLTNKQLRKTAWGATAFLVLGVGLFFGARYLDRRREPSGTVKTTNTAVSLLDLFKSDLPHTFKVTVDSNMSWHPIGTPPPSKPQYEYKSQLYLEWLSKSKFLGFYLPNHSDMAEVMIAVGLGHKHLLNDLEKRQLIKAGRAGDEPVDARNLVFTGQVLLYYEGILSPHERVRVIEKYKDMGLNPQFRGLDYLMDRRREQRSKQQ